MKGKVKLAVTCFWVAKAGNTSAEYEDAFYPKYNGKVCGQIHHFAVADGASEGMWSGKWAEILVNSFCRYRGKHQGTAEVLPKAYKAWDGIVKSYLTGMDRDNQTIPWYEEHNLHSGAFSSLLGFTIRQARKKRHWAVSTIGDSCLFQIRHGHELVTSFPMRHSADFHNRPVLVSSNPVHNTNVLSQGTSGQWKANDVFYLMTDALACWFLQEFEAGREPWLILGSLKHDHEGQLFREWISCLREQKVIRNDDVTLVRIAGCS